VVEVRRTLVWATALASVVSAMLLTSTGGGMPRIASDAPRAHTTPAEPAQAPAVVDGAHGSEAPRPAGSGSSR
jgi:hypothetical protein